MKILFNQLKIKNSKLIRFTFVFLILPFFGLQAQIFSEQDVEVCNSKFQLGVDKNLSEKPIADIIVEVGKSFIGTDYLSHSLEKNGDEQLVINLTGLDCTTFLENSLVLARCIKKGKTSFEDYMNEHYPKALDKLKIICE